MKNLNSKNAKYIASYNAWFDKLPKKQKALMKSQGLDKPHIDNYTTRQMFDVSDIPIAAPSTDKTEDIDDTKVFSKRDFSVRFSEFTDIIFEELLRRKNMTLTIECIRFIFGRSRYRSEREIASSLKMTRANVSARCVELRDKFGMEASPFGHGIRTRLSYRKSVANVITNAAKKFESISKNNITNGNN